MPQTSKISKKNKYDDVTSTNASKHESDLFSKLTFYILPTNFGSTRLKIFIKQIERHKGKVVPESQEPDYTSISHVVVEDAIDLSKIQKLLPESLVRSNIVRCTWISRCLHNKSLVDLNDNEKITLPDLKPKYNGESKCQNDLLKQDKNKSDISNLQVGLHDSEKLEPTTSNNNFPHTSEECYLPSSKGKLQQKFVCAHASNKGPININKNITDELEKLQSTYKSKNDTWRAVGYQKAISAIKNYNQEITNWEQVKNIRGIGERLADKVMEIVESGKLRKVAEVCEGEEATALKIFMGVWGAGPSTAHTWYIQGHRTLEDLRTKASLTRHQEIGLRYYDDFNSRIPRSEAAKIEDQVREGALKIQSGLEVITCGSYRRGHATCGDVDVLITHPDGRSHLSVFKPLLEYLHSTGFITDDLVKQQNVNQSKYLGVCKLPEEDSKYRRLDIIVVPYKEFAPALLYFTGSAHFNRSMRLLATKMGMSLSEHGLKTNIVRQGREKLNDGLFLETPSEESIFEQLGLKYRSPSERDH